MSRIVYVDAPTFINYAAERGVILEEDAAKKELVLAQDYIDTAYDYNGTPTNEDSAFPREGLLNYDDTTVPRPIQIATMRIALLAISGVNLYSGATSGLVKREVVATGRIETQYAVDENTATMQGSKLIPDITRLLSAAGLLGGQGDIGRLWGVRG